MRYPPSIRAALAAVALSAATSVTPFRAEAQAGGRQLPPPTPADSGWDGEYDIVAMNYPGGDYHAVLTTVVRDTLCACSLRGGYGRLTSSRVRSDTLHLVFTVGQQPIAFRLARADGTLRGLWSVGAQGGSVVATRRK